MKLPRSVTNLLENKYVLYFVLFLAVSNLLGYIMMGNMKPVFAFILIAYLVSRFSKNMILIMIIPLILISFLMVGNRVREGLENSQPPSAPTSEPPVDPNVDPIAKAAADKAAADKAAADKATADAIAAAAAAAAAITSNTTNNTNTNSTSTTTPVGQTPQVNGMTTMYKKNNRVDYAATVEDAYDDLNKILGGDGIKRLTGDTQKLMGQQMQLAEAMKSMTPLLGQAKELLKGFDLKNLGDITSMAKSFGPK